ncbi:MAG: ATP-binding protein [Kofleriaceae bacterium]|nr:ATP-binding protein [Kofleriaceae bacterium]
MFDLEPTITLPWLIRLRWALLVGQLLILVVVRGALGEDVAWWPFVVAVAVLGGSNLVLPRATTRFSPSSVMGAALLLDTAVLTIQLAGLGGAMNPFSVMYLVYITLSAVVLSARWTTAVALLSILGFALLFLVPVQAHIHVAGSTLRNPHLQGMWAAFVLAAGLTGFFVRRISRAIATQREQIATLRETAARHARHASLATLAAGAAHELNNPLSTIAVSAHEAHLRAKQLADDTVAADLELILQQVERCEAILHAMAARVVAVDATGTATTAELLAEIRAQLGANAAKLDVHVKGEPSLLALPAAPVAQSLVALIKNGLDASAPGDRVDVEIRNEGRAVAFEIADRGPGIAADVLAKVGEPFFTTKPPGRGLGLGVFLARIFFESHGGALSIESRVGQGTRALARLPIGADA